MAKQGGFFVRLCYGYVGKYKDTSKMTAKEVIEEFLKRKGVSSPREFFDNKFAGLRQSGATSGANNGAYDDDALREEEEAEKRYEKIRKDKLDVYKVSKHSGISLEKVKIAKEHLFFEKHQLTDGYRTFHAIPEIADCWERLVSGKGIQEQDRILVLHEYLEAQYMRQGMTYDEAHAKTNLKYNWEKYYK